MTWKHSLLVLVIGSWPILSFCAVNSNARAKPQKVSAQRQIGGAAGPGFSLLNIHKISSKTKKHERLIFSIGNKEGQGLAGAPGYFNIQNQNKRIIIDFAQMPLSKLNEKSIQQIIKGSRFVRSANLVQDPIDQTLTLILDTTEPVKIKTLQVKGQKQTARVVLDIFK